MGKRREGVNASKNKLVIAVSVVCFLLFAVAMSMVLWAKFSQKPQVAEVQDTQYVIVADDTVTVYEGDELLLAPHIMSTFGEIRQGRFSYAVLDAAKAPISVDEDGTVKVKENSEGTSATIEITELNTKTKKSITVTVERKLAGIKGVVFGEDLVVATDTQQLTFGESYTVTIKTVPSQAVLRNDQLTIKTVDKYGKEVAAVLKYSVVPNTNRVTISPIGLGKGTMVFSIVAEGKELCKDEAYDFSVSMKDEVLDTSLKTQLKKLATDDTVAREKIELISSDVLAKLTTLEVPLNTASLFGVGKALFPALDAVLLASATVFELSDVSFDSGVYYRVQESVFAQYVADEFWSQHTYSLVPYAVQADSELWAVYHYFEDVDGSRKESIAYERIGDDYSLKAFTAIGYVNDYYYVSGSKDPKPQSSADKMTCNEGVLKVIRETVKNGVHIEVGYTPNRYNVTYIVKDADSTEGEVAVSDERTWIYGESALLYTAEQIKKANNNVAVTKTGYVLCGWLLDPAKPNEILSVEEQHKNLTGGIGVTLYAAWAPIEYTIRFLNADEADISAKYDSDVALPTPVKTGYKFLHYKDESGKQYSAGLQRNLMAVRGTITLTAYYEAITYTVRFDTNGGVWTGAGTNVATLTYDTPYTLSELNPPQGKDSYEWMQVDSVGTPVNGKVFPAVGAIKNLTSVDGDVVYLKAVWNPIKYEIVYSFPDFTYNYADKDGDLHTAYGEYTQSRIFGDNAAMITPLRTGYTALSWKGLYYTNKGSTVKNYLKNASYNVGSVWDLITGTDSDAEMGRTYYLELVMKANVYTVTFNYDGATSNNSTSNKSVTFDGTYGTLPTPKKLVNNVGYAFEGWYYGATRITETTVLKTAAPHTLTARWTPKPISASFINTPNDLEDIGSSEAVTLTVSGGSGSYSFSPINGSGSGYSWNFDTATMRLTVKVTSKDKKGTIYITVTDNVYESKVTVSKSWSSKSCVADGTLITLADGTQKAVEDLTGDEMLLVWNFMTGSFDVAPILCIDHDDATSYEVISLHFSDGTRVKVISEHGFFDTTLGKYVYLDRDAAAYIGHSFIKHETVNGVMKSTEVVLTKVTLAEEYTSAWSPVTYGHLCLFVDGMLSMPGGLEGLFNIFEVDVSAMRYDEQAMQRDIETYGLFTYEELASLIPIPEELFDAVPCAYLKVALGKGLTTIEELAEMFMLYAELLGMA